MTRKREHDTIALDTNSPTKKRHHIKSSKKQHLTPNQDGVDLKNINLGLKLVKTHLTVTLAPKYTATVNAGIEDYLCSLVLKYAPELDGVVMFYSKVKVLESLAPIINDSPFFHVPVSASFGLFQPQENMKLVGVVNSVGSQYIGLLVYGIFNVSIDLKDIGEDYEFDIDSHIWKHRTRTNSDISKGTAIVFRVKSIIKSSEILSIKGALVNSI